MLTALSAGTGAAAAPTFVASSSAAASASQTLTLPVPAGVAPGHVLLAAVDFRAPAPISPPAGWTAVVQTTCSTSGAYLTQAVFARSASVVEPPAYTFSVASATSAAGSVIAYSGVHTGQPVDAVGGKFTKNSKVVGAPSITTTVSGDMLVAALGIVSNAAMPTPSGMTLRGDVASGSAARLLVADQLLGPVGSTGDRSARTAGANTCSVGQLVALRPAPSSPVSTAPPILSGTAQQGHQLSATSGSWMNGPTGFAYQWQRSGADVPGATGPTYSLTEADVGARIRVVVTASNAAGSASAASEPSAVVLPVPPASITPPAILGTARENETLTADTGTWSGSPTGFAYTWERCSGGTCTVIAGANGSTYTLSSADVHHGVRVVVQATNAGGSGSAVSLETAPVQPTASPANVDPPSLSGIEQEGETLTASTGTWSGSPTSFAYQWQRSTDGGQVWDDVPGASSAAYELEAADVGALVRVLVTASNAGGSTTAASAASGPVAAAAPPENVAPPEIVGIVRVGETISATAGTWSGAPATLAFRWERSTDAGVTWNDIPGAVSSTYLVQAGDLGASLRVTVTATSVGGESSATSAPAEVLPLPPESLSPPLVTGTALAGVSLAASAGAWDGSPSAFAYRWQRSSDDGTTWEDVPGAVSPVYLLLDADIGFRFRVVVTASNAGGATEAASDPTDPVVGSGAPVALQLPQLSGTVHVGRQLSSSTGSWSGSPTGYARQWQQSLDGGLTWVNLPGATGVGLNLTAAHLGTSIRLLVAATNGSGTGTAASEPVVVYGTPNVVATVNQTWICTTTVNLDLVKVAVTDGGNRDGIRFDNCSGRIGRVEVDTNGADGLKVRNTGTVAHDLVVEGGFVRCTGHPQGAHQDGIQGMGGYRITFRNLVIFCGDLGSSFGEGVNSSALFGTAGAGSSIPTDLVIEHSVMGLGTANGVLVGESIRSGIRNSVACPDETPGGGPVFFNSKAVNGIDVNNEKPPANDPRCTSFAAAVAWAQG